MLRRLKERIVFFKIVRTLGSLGFTCISFINFAFFHSAVLNPLLANINPLPYLNFLNSAVFPNPSPHFIKSTVFQTTSCKQLLEVGYIINQICEKVLALFGALSKLLHHSYRLYYNIVA